MSKTVEKEFCDRCLKASNDNDCGYLSRGLEHKCPYLMNYMDGYSQATVEFMKKAEKVFDELYIPKVKFELFKQYMENKYFPPKDKDTSTIIERSTK